MSQVITEQFINGIFARHAKRGHHQYGEALTELQPL